MTFCCGDRLSFEALLFDLDGVVINSNGPIVYFWRTLAGEYRIKLTEEDILDYIYGVPARDTLKKLFTSLSPAETAVALQKLVDFEKQQRYSGIPGVLHFLAQLKRNGIPTALVTSSEQPRAEAILHQLGLDDTFNALITAGCIKKGKPHPEAYQLAARKLRKTPRQCLVFEDAVSGVKAAVAAGSACIGLHQPEMAGRLLSAGALGVIPDFTKVSLAKVEEGFSLEFGTANIAAVHLKPGI
ncbi:MAG TPA: HAD family phosphatase [Bacillota bacterium]